MEITDIEAVLMELRDIEKPDMGKEISREII